MLIARSPTSFSLRKLSLLTSRSDRKIRQTRLKISLDYHQHILFVCLAMLWDQVLKALRKMTASNHFNYQKIHNEIVEKYSKMIKLIPDHFKTQKIEKGIKKNLSELGYAPACLL